MILGAWPVIRLRTDKPLRRGTGKCFVGCLLALLSGTSLAGETKSYIYDANGRLVKAASSGTVNNGATACYAYDPASNRSNVTTSTTALNCANAGTAVTFSIVSNGPVTEGSPSIFTVTKSGSSPGSISLAYQTSDGTAAAGVRYTSASGILTFLSGDTAKTISVPTIDDATYIGTQAFNINLTNVVGNGAIGSASGTINDNDPQSQPPVTQPDSISLMCNTTAILNVTNNDTDPGGHLPLTVISVTGGYGGTASVYSASSLLIDADSTPSTSTVTYTVKNSLNATSTGTVTITTTGNLKVCSG
ncbi:Calx-beta domain-containing protein [Sphingomonas sp. ASV193]|uniref:Calx-beta domain-containing protein n=1 Tax=Sphingomonas sp. ASV193 TaxID=3144405 RepID=UPI0032E87DE3